MLGLLFSDSMRHFFFALIILSTAVEAANSGPVDQIKFGLLKAQMRNENSFLSGECYGKTGFAMIDCTLTQTSVNYLVDPSTLNEETQFRLGKLKNEMKNDPKTFMANVCLDYQRFKVDMESNPKIISSGAHQFLQEMKALCTNPTEMAFEEWVRQSVINDSKTCKIRKSVQGPVRYKKVLPNRWVALVGPTGECRSSYQFTLEHAPESPSDWTWTQVRMSADTDKKICKQLLVGIPLTYSSAGSDVKFTCDGINFQR